MEISVTTGLCFIKDSSIGTKNQAQSPKARMAAFTMAINLFRVNFLIAAIMNIRIKKTVISEEITWL